MQHYNSIEHSPSSDTDGHYDSDTISSLSQNLKIQTGLSPVCIPSHMNSVHTFIQYFFIRSFLSSR